MLSPKYFAWITAKPITFIFLTSNLIQQWNENMARKYSKTNSKTYYLKENLAFTTPSSKELVKVKLKTKFWPLIKWHKVLKNGPSKI